jgi:glycosyltransferase involved in cell wall biosynthesis
MDTPSVTVLMPVFNAAAHLDAAIRSILVQTWRDLELLIVDDGSTDGSVALVRSFADPRIRLVQQDGHRGIVEALNRGLDLAGGALVARMDADDVSVPTRLARQVEFLERHPEIGVCGTWTRLFGARRGEFNRLPTDSDAVAAGLFFGAMLVHPTVMLRAALVRSRGLRYDPAYALAEDFELWTRATAVTQLANVPEVLVCYRRHAEQVSVARGAGQHAAGARVRARQLRRLVPDADDADVAFHQRWLDGLAWLDPDDLARAPAWAARLVTENERRGEFPAAAFRRVISGLLRQHWRQAVAGPPAGVLQACGSRPRLIPPLALAGLRRLAGAVTRRGRAMAGWPGA